MKTNTPSPSPLPRLAALAAAMAFLALPALAETVNIATAADWATFANRVNAGETSLDAKMTADVRLSQDSPFVGDDTSHPYSGTFDGAGHTLRVDWSFSDGTEHVAPFRYANACTIKDLHVTGTLQSNGKFVAGFISECLRNGNSSYTYVNNCRSSVAITCAITGDSTSGGFVGHVESANSARVECKNCLFDGSLLGPSANCCGGFTGYRPNAAYAKYYNCLFAPAEVTISTDNSYTFSRPGCDTLSSCCFLQAFGSAQGIDASAMSAEDLAAKLGDAWTVANGRAALALFPPAPLAPPGNHIAYQGALKNVSGLPLTGEKTVDFRIYDAATGGTPLWARRLAVLLDEKGLFNVELSDEAGEALEGTASSDSLAAVLIRSSSSSLYVGLTVEGSDGETVPRQRLLSVPYAVFAADTAKSSGDFAVGGRLTSSGLGVSGNAEISGNATFAGATAVQGNLGVSGRILGPGSRAAYGTAPVGAIVLWKGNSGQIPDGWKLCDGANGTPDLRDRFVVGAGGSYSVGNRGGQAGYSITVDQLPSHYHYYAGDDHLDQVKAGSTGYSAANNIQETTGGYDAVSDPSGNGRIYRTSSTGSGQDIDNRPPYYALCYIMRVK